MQILLANAKIMNSEATATPWSEPEFQDIANHMALEFAQYDIDKIALELDCNRKIAYENWQRYQQFFNREKLPAILAYNGQAYKHLKANTLSTEDLKFGQEHLWITCFLYGMLRPMDGIVPYRMEHCARLEFTGNMPVNKYWKDILTDRLIDSVKSDDGTLVHLSAEEYEHLFDWNRVCKEVEVIHPLFYVRQRDERLKTQAVWAKACRGAMVRMILRNKITNPDDLKSFCHEGFVYNPKLGEELYPHFVRETL